MLQCDTLSARIHKSHVRLFVSVQRGALCVSWTSSDVRYLFIINSDIASRARFISWINFSSLTFSEKNSRKKREQCSLVSSCHPLLTRDAPLETKGRKGRECDVVQLASQRWNSQRWRGKQRLYVQNYTSFRNLDEMQALLNKGTNKFIATESSVAEVWISVNIRHPTIPWLGTFSK